MPYLVGYLILFFLIYVDWKIKRRRQEYIAFLKENNYELYKTYPESQPGYDLYGYHLTTDETLIKIFCIWAVWVLFNYYFCSFLWPKWWPDNFKRYVIDPTPYDWVYWAGWFCVYFTGMVGLEVEPRFRRMNCKSRGEIRTELFFAFLDKLIYKPCCKSNFTRRWLVVNKRQLRRIRKNNMSRLAGLIMLLIVRIGKLLPLPYILKCILNILHLIQNERYNFTRQYQHKYQHKYRRKLKQDIMRGVIPHRVCLYFNNSGQHHYYNISYNKYYFKYNIILSYWVDVVFNVFFNVKFERREHKTYAKLIKIKKKHLTKCNKS